MPRGVYDRSRRELPPDVSPGFNDTPGGHLPESASADEEPGALFDLPDWTRAHVYRTWPVRSDRPSPRPPFCGIVSCPAGPEDIAQKWGGGVFDVFFAGSRGQRIGRRRVVIDGEPIEPRHGVEQQPAQEPADSPGLTMLVDLVRKLVDRVQAIEQRPPAEPANPMAMIAHMAELAKAMREITGGPARLDPTELVSWFKSGFEARGEVESPEAHEPTVVETVAGAASRWLELQEQRERRRHQAALIRRGKLVQMPAKIEEAKAAEPVDPQASVAADEPHAPVPPWMFDVAREIVRAQRHDDDPAFTAAFIERAAPASVVNRLRALPPSVALGEVLRIRPLVERSMPVDQEFLRQVVAALQLEEEDESQAIVVPRTEAKRSAWELAGTGDDEEDDDEDEDDEEDEDEDSDEDEDEAAEDSASEPTEEVGQGQG